MYNNNLFFLFFIVKQMFAFILTQSILCSYWLELGKSFGDSMLFLACQFVDPTTKAVCAAVTQKITSVDWWREFFSP
ncbi:hypothetical protein EDC94DRAFT_613901 [Helicostylum pulchrum]|nr:hypothetical protein EDC94DRAFT_613901 [Helicostylum pulchrum]